MKKLLCLMLAVMTLVGLLAGCASETQPQDSSTETDQTQNEGQNETQNENQGTDDTAQPESSDEETRQADPNKQKIILGITSTFEDFTYFLPEMMGEWGYEVEIKMFDDPVVCNTALIEGSIDANCIQHLPYLEAYNASNGTDLYACEPYLISSIDAIVSKKYASLDEVPNGASIAVADDASNLSVNLEDLESIGWITLKEIPEGSYYTLFDIEENPKELEFVEVSMFARYAAVDGDVDLAMVFYSNNSTQKYECNLLKLFDEGAAAYPQIIAVRGEDKDAQWVSDLMDAMTSDTFVEAVNAKNEPVPIWKILF